MLHLVGPLYYSPTMMMHGQTQIEAKDCPKHVEPIQRSVKLLLLKYERSSIFNRCKMINTEKGAISNKTTSTAVCRSVQLQLCIMFDRQPVFN
jgi:hypothetical protein